MSRRSEEMLAEHLRRRREQASKDVALSSAGVDGASLLAGEKSEALVNRAAFRQRELDRQLPGAWAGRQALFVRTAGELSSLAEERDAAVAKLRASRERMRQSADALARAIALERAARRAGMTGQGSG